MKGNWTQSDILFLRENYSSLDFKELCLRLDRSEDAVRWKASQLRLTIPKIDYTPGDDLYIKTWYKKKTIEEIALDLCRTKSSVNKRITLICKRRLRKKSRNLITIDESIPVPLSDAEELLNALSELKVGQSFSFDRKKQFTLRQQYYFLKNRKFTIKKTDNEYARVWRIL